MSSDDDPFDDVLNLEEKYYKEGYDEGHKDGAEAGKTEGRSVGMKKGFEKFVEAGRLQGKAIVWANRIPNLRKQSVPVSNSQKESERQTSSQEPSSSSQGEKEPEPGSEPEPEPKNEPETLPPLSSNARLEKNVTMLYGLVEPGTLSTKNDDESVNDFDSRMKGAQGRLKMIERAVGEGTRKGSSDRFRPSQPAQKNENIEDIGAVPRRKGTEGEK